MKTQGGGVVVSCSLLLQLPLIGPSPFCPPAPRRLRGAALPPEQGLGLRLAHGGSPAGGRLTPSLFLMWVFFHGSFTIGKLPMCRISVAVEKQLKCHW